MSLLAEQPLLVSIMLGVLGVGLLYGWLQSGTKPMAIAGLVLLLLIPVAWWLAGTIVTDRERIEIIIQQTADAVEANDHRGAVSVIGDIDTRAKAMAELPQWEFHQADVGSIQNVRIVEGTSPLQADVEMTVKVDVSSKRGSVQRVRVPRRLFLTFEKRGGDDSENGGWVVTKYSHGPIVGKMDALSP